MAPSIALSTSAGLVLAGLGAVIFLAAAGYLATRGGWRAEPGERTPEIPAAMTPGPADADLDTTILERLQGWGIVLVLFFVIWIPVYWLNQPSTNLANQEALKTKSIERGHEITLPNNEAVNPGGVGCVLCHGSDLHGGMASQQGNPYPAPPLFNVCDYTQHPAIKTLDDLRRTIEQGRPGTPMPSWSVKYQGAMDDQQIDDVINYLISVNEKTVPFDNNVCTNPKAGSPTPAAAPSGSPEASPSP